MGAKVIHGIVSTEYGVVSPWGTDSVRDLETAQAIVHNMRTSGHEAHIVWRGVTEWQEQQ